MCFSAITKRDGRIAAFDPAKITAALLKAGKATGEFETREARRLTMRVFSLARALHLSDIPDVENIQDVVERVLLDSPFRGTAKAYILYREQRAQLRRIKTKANTDLMEGYLNKMDWRVRENSNMGFSLQGLNNYIASDITSEYWLNRIYTPPIRDAHTDGDFHLHDLNLLSVYCVGWDLSDLLRQGFKGVAGNVESAPPRHFRSALGQLVNFFYTLQGEAAGAQAVSSFDSLLAPFIRYDQLEYKEVKQALQEFVFNINIPTRVGFQTPFTNITMDMDVPGILKNVPVVIGGEDQKEVYGDFQTEMDMLNQAFAEVMLEGDNKGRVFTFPIPTYNITKEFDWGSSRFETVWEMTGRYGIPYFSNFVNSDMSPEDARSMCCRLRLDTRELRKRGGGLFGANPLTGSIGVVTINLPRLGYLAKNEREFLDRLDALMELAKESLVIKRKELERFTDGGLYPYTTYYLRAVKARTQTYWSNHFSTIGIVGMNEACANLLGKGIGTPEGQAFSLRALVHMRHRLERFQKETGNFFNLEATPAEGASYRLALLDRKKFPEILFANGKAGQQVPYYTNSTHLPVDYSTDIFDVLDLQDDLQCSYTGGTVLHGFIGEEITDTRTVRNMVRTITENYHLPYFTLTPTFSICAEHGYLKGEQKSCPVCQEDTEVYSRVVGYLRPVGRWNDGKQAEYAARTPYTAEIFAAQLAAGRVTQDAGVAV
ncbi:MAG: anaerobic ribonucleoside-triphosphate reductase [Candidatus Desulfovibrio kirbyi]|uniref:Anaerobic ribonucleoside-triphosphate reductase n=1 Tax=Candidatus Desulfovibrio kirbyi TaxID=2696086 RepID=A0A6L2R5L9_9BACT|nr:MAG: anaerobic ribonucleoside-triphosphate reductase [Candidatus Desulfovibrio kirbyi]